jgi:hypothetical protein
VWCYTCGSWCTSGGPRWIDHHNLIHCMLCTGSIYHTSQPLCSWLLTMPPPLLPDYLPPSPQVPRPLPWYHTPAGTRRGVEGVRPIYWQYRPKAYLRRTQDWPAYPTSRCVWCSVAGGRTC